METENIKFAIRHLFCISVLFAACLKAEPLIKHEPGVFFTEAEQKFILNKPRLESDLLVLCDGTCLSGKMLQLPKVDFPYGNFPLPVQNVSAIAFAGKKIQLITNEGYVFVFNRKNDPVPFVHLLSSSKAEEGGGYKELDCGGISYVLFQGASSSGSKPDDLYRVELKDGTQLTVLFAEDIIHLNNGWYPFFIHSNRLLEAEVDGGLYGTILDQSGNKAPIEYVFFEDPLLRVKLIHSPSVIKIPWSQVQSIRKQQSSSNDGVDSVANDYQSAVVHERRIDHPPARFSTGSPHAELEEFVWVEEPLPLFNSDSAQVDIDAVAWLNEPPSRFAPESARVDAEAVAWLSELPSRFTSDSSRVDAEVVAWLNEPPSRFAPDSARVEEDAVAWLSEPPSRFTSDSARVDAEAVAWLSEPPSRFTPDSSRVEEDAVAWLSEPPSRFAPDSARVDLNGLAWVEESIQLPFDETMQLALADSYRNSKASEREVWERQSHSNDRIAKARILDLIDYFSSQIKSVEDEKAKLKEAVFELSKESKKVFEENQALKKSHEGLVEAKYVMQKTIDQLFEQAAMNKDRIEKLSQDLLRSKSMVSNKDQLYTELLNAFKTMESENESLVANRQILDDKINQLRVSLSQQANEREALLKLVEQKQNEVKISDDEHARQLEILASEIQSLCYELSVREQEQKALAEQTAQLTNQLNESHQSLASVKEQMEEKDRLAGVLKEEMQEIKLKLEDAAKDKERIAEMIGEIEVRNQQILADNRELKVQRDVSLMNIEKYDELLRRSEVQLSEKTAQLDQLQKSYHEVLKREEETGHALANARDEGGKALAELIQLNEQLSREKKLNGEFKRKMDQFFPEYDKQKEKNLQLNQQVSRLTQKINEFEDALKVAETRHAAIRGRYADLVENNGRLLQEKEQLTNQLLQVQNRLQEYRDLASRLNDSINAVNRDVDSSRQLRNYQSPAPALSNSDHSDASPERAPTNFSSPIIPGFISFKEIHVIAEGENLNNISMMYYNTPNRWEDIYEANRDVISDVDRLQVGASLVIPE